MMYSEQREDVCSTAREILRSNLVTGTWGNVSVKIEGADIIVITPSGMDYNTLGAEDMVVVQGDERVLEGTYKPSIETFLHLQLYKSLPEMRAVVHVHSPYATAFAVAGISIPLVLEEALRIIGHEVRVVPYAPCGSRELAYNVAKIINGTEKAILLGNHGMIGLGDSTAAALKVCYTVEKTAMIALFSRILGHTNCLKLD